MPVYVIPCLKYKLYHRCTVPPYLNPQFSYNQVMLQNAAMQAAMQSMNMNMNPQQLNMGMNIAAMMQGRPPSVTGNLNSPSILSPSPTTPTQQAPVLNFSSVNAPVTSAASQATVAKVGADGKTSEAMALPQQAQATALVGGKPIMSTQGLAGAQPLVLGVLPSQVTNAQGFVNQTKGQAVAVSFAHANQPQVITSQSVPARFTQPQIVSSSAQMSSQPMLTNQAVLQAMAGLQQQGIPLAHQPLFSAPGQSQAIQLNSLYIRTANPMQAQQGLMAATGVQTIGTLKGTRIDTPQNLQVKASVGPMQLTKPEFNQVGKALLPAKTVTAKVPPNISGQRPKLSIPNLTKNATRGRPKNQSKIASTPTATASTNTVASALAQAKANSAALNKAKPAVPAAQAVNLTTQAKAKPDTEADTTKKNGLDESIKNKVTDNKTADVHLPEKPTEPVKPTVIVENKAEKMDTSEKQETKEKEVPVVVEKQKAIVKPHILTHVIEGFVIQEGPEPFPVQQSSLLTEFIPPKPGETKLTKPSQEDVSNSESQDEFPVIKEAQVKSPAAFEKCEFCGTSEQTKFKRSKRFCSIACAKRFNVSRRIAMLNSKPKGRVGRPPNPLKKKKALLNMRKGWRPGKGDKSYSTNNKGPDEMEADENQYEMDQSSSQSGNESSSTPDSPTTPHGGQGEAEMETENPPTNPGKWNVLEVYEFIKSMPGCAPYADEFRSQEIDGQALMLLKEDHLMTAMNMKLGPALKICAKINSIKDEFV
ncbi:hypothetical protein KUTeg_001432 [Tegillarca granosa]|uniref:SAM domain-containing protein n=1 Tax=Tegillarca granosa TaxID=220873 RepID=A0ABQ9FVT3_TEGGR|nr:hypothetical protein KUTeg_001432 [Tegillarca granosa]